MYFIHKPEIWLGFWRGKHISAPCRVLWGWGICFLPGKSVQDGGREGGSSVLEPTCIGVQSHSCASPPQIHFQWHHL